MKNRATPLAAALILAATAASAQTPPYTSGGSSFNSNSNPFGAITIPNTDPDWIFKCGTPPYLQCTPTEILRRDAVKTAQKCPTVPATTKCADWVMRNGDSNPMANYAASTPPNGFKWSSPDCTRIPCRIDPIAPTTPTRPNAATAPTPNQEYGVTGGLIGPPDLRDTGPQPYADDDSFKAAIAAQEAATPGKVIDLGNRTYAVDDGNGEFTLGATQGGYPISFPRKAADIPGLQVAIEKKAVADKLAAEQLKAEQNMFTGASAGGDQNRTAATPGGGRSDGADVDGVQRQLGGGGSGGPSVTSSGGTTGSTGGGTGGGGPSTSSGDGKDVIKIAGSTIKVGEIETTFVNNQKVEKLINGAAKTYKNGDMTNFVDSSGQVGGTVQGRMADPPTSEFQGKQQWAAQEGPKKP